MADSRAKYGAPVNVWLKLKVLGPARAAVFRILSRSAFNGGARL